MRFVVPLSPLCDLGVTGRVFVRFIESESHYRVSVLVKRANSVFDYIFANFFRGSYVRVGFFLFKSLLELRR